MKSNMLLVLSLLFVLFLTACQGAEKQQKIASKSEKAGKSITEISLPTPPTDPKEFNITAKETEWEIKPGKTIKAWTYNGTVPGEEIRVKEGEFLKVNLKNELPDPVTIHWHGMILPNVMDGVPGVTQNSVLPGESFTYEFQANQAGTYWYHSHQQSSNQVDKGLYGALVVEPKSKTYDVDETFILDEWALEGGSGMGSMMGSMVSGDRGDMDTKMQYDTFTVNGKSYPNVNPIQMKQGETMRLRFVNAGYAKHQLSFENQAYRIVASDANEIKEGNWTKGILEIAPGERMDVEMTAFNSGSWEIRSVDNDAASTDMAIPVKVSPSKKDQVTSPTITKSNDVVDLAQYGQMNSFIKLGRKPDLSYIMNLDASMGMGNMVFTINGEVFPDTEAIRPNKGDLVKVTLNNNSMLDHPMHLHGHHFQVVSKNGKKLDSPLVKDLINVKPGESYDILFEAENPGEWMFHCHDLNHATGGMVTLVKYNGYYSPFKLEGSNQPD